MPLYYPGENYTLKPFLMISWAMLMGIPFVEQAEGVKIDVVVEQVITSGNLS